MSDEIKAIATSMHQLASQAFTEYSVILNELITTKSTDNNRIEHTLDGMLDFCFDDKILLLYRRLCRYYFDINPTATASYINSYRDMWDTDDSNKKI